ncbi:MAG: dihydrolipoyl dehydrogenase family protein [Methyloligellaceae bacterium]
MAELLTPDLCIIGAGSGGLSVASAAAQMGVDVVLVEKGKMGGDCLNYGCVPSKALIAASKKAHTMRSSVQFGIRPVDPVVDWAAVNDHIKSVIAAIEPNDSVERFTGLGVKVIEAAGSFKDRRTVVAGDYEIKARRTIIATGSSAAVPPIPGIDQIKYMTNETIFENREKIDHLIIVGGGPIGMELAQAHRRLGAKVTVLEAFSVLTKDDPELTKFVIDQIKQDGVDIYEGVRVERLERDGAGIRVFVSKDGETGEIQGSHLLIAAGRKPNIDGLNLEAGGIKYERAGIKVSKSLKTTNGRVFAIGDVAGGLQFTHVANYHAGIVIRRALFRMPVKATSNAIPWVTYTAPELANVGMTEEQAKKKYSNIRILRWPYAENDRAQAERQTDGMVKVITTKGGKILGAGIVGAQAGELIQMWALAITKKMKIGDMTSFTSPYPTLTELNKRVAYTYFTPSLGNPWLRKTIKFLAKFG